MDSDGIPNITPVGTVFFRDDCTGFYFDQYTSALARRGFARDTTTSDTLQTNHNDVRRRLRRRLASQLPAR